VCSSDLTFLLSGNNKENIKIYNTADESDEAGAVTIYSGIPYRLYNTERVGNYARRIETESIYKAGDYRRIRRFFKKWQDIPQGQGVYIAQNTLMGSVVNEGIQNFFLTRKELSCVNISPQSNAQSGNRELEEGTKLQYLGEMTYCIDTNLPRATMVRAAIRSGGSNDGEIVWLRPADISTGDSTSIKEIWLTKWNDYFTVINGNMDNNQVRNFNFIPDAELRNYLQQLKNSRETVPGARINQNQGQREKINKLVYRKRYG
jgi:hypothetical protein